MVVFTFLIALETVIKCACLASVSFFLIIVLLLVVFMLYFPVKFNYVEVYSSEKAHKSEFHSLLVE